MAHIQPSQKIWFIEYPYTFLLPKLFPLYSAIERNMGKKKSIRMAVLKGHTGLQHSAVFITLLISMLNVDILTQSLIMM